MDLSESGLYIMPVPPQMRIPGPKPDTIEPDGKINFQAASARQGEFEATMQEMQDMIARGQATVRALLGIAA
jgi:hypothetical protein